MASRHAPLGSIIAAGFLAVLGLTVLASQPDGAAGLVFGWGCLAVGLGGGALALYMVAYMPAPTSAPAGAPREAGASRLARLDRMHRDGIITKAEYAKRRSAILDHL